MIIDLDQVAALEKLTVGYTVPAVGLGSLESESRYHWAAACHFACEARSYAVDLRPEDCRVLSIRLADDGAGTFAMGWRPEKVATFAVLADDPSVLVEIEDITEPVEIGGWPYTVVGWSDTSSAWALGRCRCYVKPDVS